MNRNMSNLVSVTDDTEDLHLSLGNKIWSTLLITEKVYWLLKVKKVGFYRRPSRIHCDGRRRTLIGRLTAKLQNDC